LNTQPRHGSALPPRKGHSDREKQKLIYVKFDLKMHKDFKPMPDALTELSKQLSIGVLARLGRPLPFFSPYLTAGVEAARFSVLYKNIDSTAGDDPIFRKKHIIWRPAFVVGAGVEKAFSPKVSFRLDYACRIFRGIGKTNRDDANANILQMASKVRSHCVTAGILYKL
jgi:opacity protein-like surface antigen